MSVQNIVYGCNGDVHEWLKEAGVIESNDSNVYHVVIEFKPDDLVCIYLEKYGTNKLFVRAPNLDGAKVEVVK